MLNFITSLFTEKKCFSCQRLGHFFCPSCSEDLFLYKPYCYVCKKESTNFTVHNACQTHFPLRQVIVLTRYRNAGIKKLLRHAKYYNRYLAYSDIILDKADFFIQYVQQDSLLVPVPMHFLRKWKRGYNQSEKIAKNLSKICEISVCNSFILRSKYTKQQSNLSQSDRAHNLDNAFRLGKTKINKSTTIYLVDDVISTGSTVREIASYLSRHGYKDVRAVVLASD